MASIFKYRYQLWLYVPIRQLARPDMEEKNVSVEERLCGLVLAILLTVEYVILRVLSRLESRLSSPILLWSLDHYP